MAFPVDLRSIVAFVEVMVLSSIMLKRDHRLFNATFWNGVVKIMSVTGFSVVACFIMLSLYPLALNDRGFITLGSKLLFISAVTMSVHIGISAVFDLDEVRPIFRRVRRFIFSPVKVQ